MGMEFGSFVDQILFIVPHDGTFGQRLSFEGKVFRGAFVER